MSDTPETDPFIQGFEYNAEFAALTAHAKRMERQRNDVFNDLKEAKRLLEWHTRKTQAAVDAYVAAKKELDELKAHARYDDMMA